MCGHIFERGNADRRKRYLTFGMQAWNNFHPPLSLVTKHLRIINKTLCTNSWNWCQNRSAESGLGISDMSHTSVWLIVMSHMWVKVRHKACEINQSAWHGWHTTFDFRCAMITLIKKKWIEFNCFEDAVPWQLFFLSLWANTPTILQHSVVTWRCCAGTKVSVHVFCRTHGPIKQGRKRG